MHMKEAWILEFWSNNNGECAVEKWLDSLTDDQLKSISKELKLLELCGNSLKLPHSRSLKRG